MEGIQAIKSALLNVRKLRWHVLESSFPRFGSQIVKAELCRRVLAGTVYSDLDKFPLSQLTEFRINAHGLDGTSAGASSHMALPREPQELAMTGADSQNPRNRATKLCGAR